MDRQRATRWIVTTIAVAAFVIHQLRPALLALDNTSLALLAVAALPWLAHLVKTVELPGGFKVELQQIREEAERARGEALSASKQAAAALGVAAGSVSAESGTQSTDEAALQQLIEQYDHIRATQERSSARTQAMTDIVNKMMLTAPRVASFDVAKALKAPKDLRGLRLAAFARMWIAPEVKYLDELVEALTRIEDKPFGQYWGIMALKKTLAAHRAQSLTRPQLRQLEEYLATLPRDTDRHAELAPLVSEIRRWQRAD